MDAPQLAALLASGDGGERAQAYAELEATDDLALAEAQRDSIKLMLETDAAAAAAAPAEPEAASEAAKLEAKPTPAEEIPITEEALAADAEA